MMDLLRPGGVPAITAVRLSGARNRAELPLLVLGPSLGTSATALWSACAAELGDAFDLVAWDLPGHGHNRAVPEEPFTMAELAAGVLHVVDDLLAERDQVAGPFYYCGDSAGGAVGLQLLLDAPDRVRAAVLVATGAKIGEPAGWTGRMGQVSVSGTSVMVTGAAERWFAPGFAEREPARVTALLHSLRDADDGGYTQVCGALAEFDVRDRLAEITAPVLAVSGSEDPVTPTDTLRQIADGVRDGRLVELAGVGHLAPVEAPVLIARLLRHHLLGEPMPEERTEDGAGTTDFTRDFQELITQYAWGSIWTRPGLDRRSRSLITLTALVARGHHDELAMHLRAARTNGLSVEEIKELLLQTAVYCGLPDANTAFRIAQQVLAEEADS